MLLRKQALEPRAQFALLPGAHFHIGQRPCGKAGCLDRYLIGSGSELRQQKISIGVGAQVIGGSRAERLNHQPRVLHWSAIAIENAAGHRAAIAPLGRAHSRRAHPQPCARNPHAKTAPAVHSSAPALQGLFAKRPRASLGVCRACASFSSQSRGIVF
ncbi:hypothetical protein ACP_2158 [Acidobacterium capsulatum ATCC 51196]|uniref:Uncharacterized protein n=1 Tax=Acidobacterium capsulatum (strain ATCC 51196 / DSM 11244 / BCRC 80197 / JCM 7670 / NBRC 15755 / NCIMB 13165 / 161) TaxID=240015 RepID=C1F9K1_ACIC5|nr:hypothetical protein ACP_2158 [Acidobacterium capsulatum ATCC 51196]